jgi:hypothetical protein
MNVIEEIAGHVMAPTVSAVSALRTSEQQLREDCQ